jgi:2-polyprenyl-3-methyl-5-hydroxy-6-metoxy-1,4-benzoquinol methylase
MIRMRIALLLYEIGFLPSKYKAIVISAKASEKAKKIFDGRKLKKHDCGYWTVEPMPTDYELEEYYRNTYWSAREGGKSSLVILRDIDHLLFLKIHAQKLFLKTSINLLNFGAGHGGFSHLMHAMGHNVYNVEPSGIETTYPDRWEYFSTMNEINRIDVKFDLIYSSHSLEHVIDVDLFMENVSDLISDSGYLFFEVPNCNQTKGFNGGSNGIIRAPHTYYFSLKYFETLCPTTLINKSFFQTDHPNTLATNEDGDVIRFLGQGKPYSLK